MINNSRFSSLLKDRRSWAGAIFVLVLILGWPASQSPVVYPDSLEYLNRAMERLPVYSLLASATGDSYALICLQFVLSLVAWTVLGYVAAGAAGVAVGACVAGAWPVALWNHTVLSESLSLTLFAASLAATCLLFRGHTRARFVLWCVVLVLFAFTRSTNVFMVPFLVVPFFVTGRRQLILVAAAAAVIMAAWGIYGNTVGSALRETSLVNVYLKRIVHHDDKRPYFVERGMPVDETIRSFIGKKGKDVKGELFAASPEFEKWFRDKGAATYRSWVATHALAYRQAWSVMTDNVNYQYPEYDDGMRSRPAYGFFSKCYTLAYVPYWLWLFLAFIPLAGFGLSKKAAPGELLIPAVMAGAFIQAFVGYHGDATEMGRHSILALVSYKIVILLAAVWIVGVVREHAGSVRTALTTGKNRPGSKPGKRRKKQRSGGRR